jgi:hypothetical protein
MLRILSSLLIISLLTSCHSSTESTWTVATGGIRGQVQIFDYNLGAAASDGIAVVLDDNRMKTTTDIRGNWKLSNVEVGTHTVVVSKLGYGKIEMYDIQVAANGDAIAPAYHIYPSYLFYPPNGTVHVNSITMESDSQLGRLYDGFTTSLQLDSVEALSEFLDTSANVEPGDPHLLVLEWNGPSGSSLWTTSHYFTELREMGIRSGTILYYSACDYSIGNRSGAFGYYDDQKHNQIRIISPGKKSNVIPFRMP